MHNQNKSERKLGYICTNEKLHMAKDIYHDHVREILELNGWKITHDPYYVRVGGIDFFMDLGAEGVIGAEKEGHKIAVEIKSFVSLSKVADFHEAYGKFMFYRKALRKEEPDRLLFLAISAKIWRTFFQKPFIQSVIEEEGVQLIVFNYPEKTLESWIEQ